MAETKPKEELTEEQKKEVAYSIYFNAIDGLKEAGIPVTVGINGNGDVLLFVAGLEFKDGWLAVRETTKKEHVGIS